jgi:arsenate reductase
MPSTGFFMSHPKTKVMFLSTKNAARGQMAEAYLRHYGGDNYEVHSAGLDPSGIHPAAVRVMEEAGLTLDGQSSKHVAEYLGRVHFGWLITVCSDAEQNCPRALLGISNRLYWGDLASPTAFAGDDEETLQEFRQARDQIERRIKEWLDEQKKAT